MRTALNFWATAVLGAAVVASPFILNSAQAGQKIGVAAAVKPDATSQPPGGSSSTLNIGKSVLYNERIDTSSSGQVQVLLLDGSTFTVGPGSSLVIDKFVYNPSSGKGALVASFSKGALRFVGGKLSKTEPGVKVKTPAGELTVRGGIALMVVNGPNRAAFALVFGDSLSIVRAGLRDTLTPGSMFVVSGPGPAVERASNGASINSLLAAVAGQSWKKTVSSTRKGQRYPFYYGIQPTGRYPDEPFIREWQYDGATTGLLINGLKVVPQATPEPPRVIPPQIPSIGLDNCLQCGR